LNNSWVNKTMRCITGFRKSSYSLSTLTVIVLVVSEMTSSVSVVSAFVNSPTSRSPIENMVTRSVQSVLNDVPTNGRQQPSALHMSGWEDVIFNAQSTASSWASASLKDPSNVFASLPVMYGAGLLTSISPCVWGLLPLTMSYISNAAGEREDKGTLLPTLAFAAGLAAVFCSLGLFAASVGGVVFGNSGNTNFLLPLVSNGVCCLMGLQLLDLIQLPSLKASPVSTPKDELILIDGTGQILSKEKEGEGGSLFRTFLLGGSSALVASPCATPVLTSILAFVANTSDPILGASLLFIFTLGYSTPLLIIAATGGQALIKLKQLGSENQTTIYAQIAPWITPITAGILLWFGTDGLLRALLGDPSLAGLAPIIE
jgi:cytochrome c-type biogenesis protein